MKMKPKLFSNKRLTLNALWLNHLISHDLDLIVGGGLSDDVDCLYYTDHWNENAIRWHDKGGKVIVDHLQEGHLTDQYPDNSYTLQNWNWFWYQESLWYKYLGYDSFIPTPQWTFRSLMPIGRTKGPREHVINLLGKDNLKNFIWSYTGKGRRLPNDKNEYDQRYFNPEWYNLTSMTLVLESEFAIDGIQTTPFVTEKTFKPIAYHHPFVVMGPAGTLEFLHNLGFETFENLFDESYDSILDWHLRCRTVIDTVLAYEPRPWDKITLEKLEYNRQRFFDQSLVTKKVRGEVILPLINYAKT